MRTRRALISITRREPWRKLQGLKLANGTKRVSSMRFSKKSACTRNLIRRYVQCDEIDGYQEKIVRIVREVSPLSVFIGGPVMISSGFPVESFGNDKPIEVWK